MDEVSYSMDDAASIEGQRGQLIAAVAQAESRIAETSFQIIQLDEQMRAEAMQELREMQSKIAEYTERRVAAEDQLKRIDIRAPSDGYVHQLNVHTIGGVISPAEPVMLIVPTNDKLELEAKVLPNDIDQVKVGQKATVKVRIGFNELDPRILPDMGVKVSFLGEERPAATGAPAAPRAALPKDAVRSVDGRTVVFVVKDQRVERRAIALGLENGGEVEVVSGVSAGERVVLNAPQTLKDGDKVKVQ